MEEMTQRANRPLDQVYAAIFLDAIVVKVRDGQVANRPVYAAIGVSLAGEKDVLGLWAGTGGEGAKFWLSVLTDLKNRGVADVFFLVCDGLKGLPEVVGNVWPLTTVQTCIIHLLRNTFRLASRRDWDRLKRDLRLIYCAPNEPAARAGLDELTEAWGARYPAIIRLWENAWAEFIPFLDYDLEIRTVICSTDEIVKPVAAVTVGFLRYRHLGRRGGAVKMQRPTERTILTALSTGASSKPEEPLIAPELVTRVLSCVSVSWSASERRTPGSYVQPARRSPFPGYVVACRCRPPLGCRGCHDGTAPQRRVRTCGVCG